MSKTCIKCEFYFKKDDGQYPHSILIENFIFGEYTREFVYLHGLQVFNPEINVKPRN